MKSFRFWQALAAAALVSGCSGERESPRPGNEATAAAPDAFADAGRLFVSPGMEGIEKFPRSMILDRPSAIRLLERAYAGSDAVSGVVLVDGRSYSAEPRLAFTYQGRSYLVVAHGLDEAAHVESGSLSYFVFDSDEGGPLHSLPFVLQGGSFGQEPTIEAVRLANGEPAAIVSGGGTWQGCSNVSSQIIRFAPTGIVASSAFPRQHANESGFGAATEFDLVGAQLSPDGASLTLRYLGDSEYEGDVTPISEVRTLHLSGPNPWVETWEYWC
jgi:hypothetical protein